MEEDYTKRESSGGGLYQERVERRRIIPRESRVVEDYTKRESSGGGLYQERVEWWRIIPRESRVVEDYTKRESSGGGLYQERVKWWRIIPRESQVVEDYTKRESSGGGLYQERVEWRRIIPRESRVVEDYTKRESSGGGLYQERVEWWRIIPRESRVVEDYTKRESSGGRSPSLLSSFSNLLNVAVCYTYQHKLLLLTVPMYFTLSTTKQFNFVAIVDCIHVGSATASVKDLVILHRRTLPAKQKVFGSGLVMATFGLGNSWPGARTPQAKQQN